MYNLSRLKQAKNISVLGGTILNIFNDVLLYSLDPLSEEFFAFFIILIYNFPKAIKGFVWLLSGQPDACQRWIL